MTDVKKLNSHSSGSLVAELRQRNSTITDAEAKLAISRVFDSISAIVSRDEQVRISNFGTFKRHFVPGGDRRNPATGAVVKTSDKHVIRFKQGKIA